MSKAHFVNLFDFLRIFYTVYKDISRRKGMNMKHLAWHETLDLHELVAFQSVGVFKLKKGLADIQDPTLRSLYLTAIKAMESNLKELLGFYPMAPTGYRKGNMLPESGMFAGDLLVLAKTAVRNYAIAITETATPMLREVLVKQLNAAIQLHAMVYYYMYEKGLYPSYNLDQLLMNDVNLANTALGMPY
jgi:spore coat protein F